MVPSERVKPVSLEVILLASTGMVIARTDIAFMSALFRGHIRKRVSLETFTFERFLIFVLITAAGSESLQLSAIS